MTVVIDAPSGYHAASGAYIRERPAPGRYRLVACLHCGQSVITAPPNVETADGWLHSRCVS